MSTVPKGRFYCVLLVLHQGMHTAVHAWVARLAHMDMAGTCTQFFRLSGCDRIQYDQYGGIELHQERKRPCIYLSYIHKRHV